MELCSGWWLFLTWMWQHVACSIAMKFVELEFPVGKLRGYTEDVLDKQVDVFLGVPYAAPPVGAYRFMRPRPLRKWQNTRNATKLPPSCHQMVDRAYDQFEGVDMWNPNTVMSEDCLYLNIWTPSARGYNGSRAVMVWIFGGGFSSGSSTLDIYNGRILAATQGVVVVSMQYRIGPLGFLYLGLTDAPGSMGMVDQQMALQWVYNYIGAFGGDSHRITVFGESAGAVSAGLHLLSPLSKNLVNNAILQSSSPLCPWAVDEPEVAKKNSHALARLLGCQAGVGISEKDTLRCLKKVDPQLISDKQWGVDDRSVLFTPLVPTIDGYFLREHPRVTMQEGRYKKSQVLLGSNKDEGLFFLMYSLSNVFNLVMNKSLTEEQFRDCITRLIKADSDLIIEAVAFEYGVPSDYDNPQRFRDAMDDVLGDLAFICPVVEFADSFSLGGGSAYLYRFLHHTSANPWPNWMGILHGYEIDTVFGMPLNQSHTVYTEEERTFSRHIMTYWSNFAKTGDPNLGIGTPHKWPLYNVKEKPHLVLNTEKFSLDYGLRYRQCIFWQKMIPKLKEAANEAHSSETCGVAVLRALCWLPVLTSITLSMLTS